VLVEEGVVGVPVEESVEDADEETERVVDVSVEAREEVDCAAAAEVRRSMLRVRARMLGSSIVDFRT